MKNKMKEKMYREKRKRNNLRSWRVSGPSILAARSAGPALCLAGGTLAQLTRVKRTQVPHFRRVPVTEIPGSLRSTRGTRREGGHGTKDGGARGRAA
ncbi:hypothetical protein E2C01_074759 [Portunus trituberculatus]|uniref:Uncharacterized protein n=1 Tax=Portunus trituberculatus TaxID=210409 RepID=A0A5B7IH30_PORTR|nr:hypothetical protein [Portunus trituberculatus]